MNGANMKFVSRVSFLLLLLLILRLLWTGYYSLETREQPCEENYSRLEEDMTVVDGLLDELDAELKVLLQEIQKEDVRVSETTKRILEKAILEMRQSHTKIKDEAERMTLDIHTSPWYLAAWRHWQNSIDQFQLYDPDDPVLQLMLRDMRIEQVDEVKLYPTGSMLKLNITLRNEQQIMFKPMRYPRSVEQIPDQFYYLDFERHTSEIAGFHLDKILGFYRVPPTTGRFINVDTDIEGKAEYILAKNVYPSAEGDMCFYVDGSDSNISSCDDSLPICGHPTEVEGAAVAFVPTDELVVWEYPWARTRQWNTTAEWEENDDYCEKVRASPPYNEGRRLLDMVDMAIFDFLQGNMERDRYETFSKFGNYTYPIHMDNSQGFGKSYEDELTILAPLYQCCYVRFSTVLRLWDFYDGPQRLSELMRASLYPDPLQPVLLERSLRALDRRVGEVLEEVAWCINADGWTVEDVIIDDGI